MKTKVVLISLLLITMILIGAQEVFAQRSSETAGGTLFDQLVNKRARGAEFRGKIVIGYAASGQCSDGGPNTNMLILLRFGKGDDMQVFWNSDAIPVCYFDVEAQAQIVADFVATNVIPVLFPDAKSWALKSIKNAVDTGMTYGGIAEFLADIVIAIKEKPDHGK